MGGMIDEPATQVISEKCWKKVVPKADEVLYPGVNDSTTFFLSFRSLKPNEIDVALAPRAVFVCANVTSAVVGVN